jgi:hypothetical protein
MIFLSAWLLALAFDREPSTGDDVLVLQCAYFFKVDQ